MIMLTFLQSINIGLENYILLLASKQLMFPYNIRVHKFSKNLAATPPNSRHHTHYMKQVPYWEPKILKLPVSLFPGMFCLVHVK